MFVGRHRRRTGKSRELHLPAEYRARALTSNWVLVPTERGLWVLPNGSDRERHWAMDILETGRHLVSRDLAAALRGQRVRRSAATHASDETPTTLKRAGRMLDEEIRRLREHGHEIDGRGFEDLVRAVLREAGATVAGNVRIKGLEVDVLLVELPANEKLRFTFVECKHRVRSGRKASVSHVARMYGLSEAMRDEAPSRRAMIVSSTGFSGPAAVFSRLYNLDLKTFDQVIEWAELERDAWSRVSWPIFSAKSTDAAGRIYIPAAFSGYASLRETVVVCGAGRYLQLYREEEYLALARHPREVTADLADTSEISQRARADWVRDF